MVREIKVGDKVSFQFAGESLIGKVLEFYDEGGRAMVSDGKYKYPIEIELLTKIK